MLGSVSLISFTNSVYLSCSSLVLTTFESSSSNSSFNSFTLFNCSFACSASFLLSETSCYLSFNFVAVVALGYIGVFIFIQSILSIFTSSALTFIQNKSKNIISIFFIVSPIQLYNIYLYFCNKN